MPQVKAEHRGALVNFLNARGVAHEQDEEVDPTTLKPTQAEFSPKKVQQANEYQGGNRSILVSSDGHVVDGHHQWLSALSKGEPIKAIRLDAPIADLLPLVKEFPSSTESKATTQPQPEQRREERQAEAAPLLNREVAPPSNAAPTYTGKAPWEMALDEFAQSRIDASGYADAYREDPKAADAFKKGQQSKWIDALRARAEEGRISDVALDDFVGRYGMPALHREFRGVLEKGIEGYQPPEIRNSPIRKTPETAQNQPWEMTWEEYRKKATPDGVPDKAAKTPAYWKSLKNQHRNIIARALSRKESVPDRVFSDYPDLKPAKETSAAADQPTNKKPADLIGDAARMGATEAEMMAAIEAGDGKALERIADRQHEKTGGLLLGFGNGKLSQSFGYKKVERHPAHDYKNWENLTDAQVNAFSKAASIKPGKTRQETLDRIDSRKTPAEWAEAWDKAFPENRNRLTDIGKAETAPNRTEYQGKDTDKKADIKSSKQSPPPASQGAARNRAINATVDAGKDSILTAIAKIGGLDRAEAQRQGIDPAEFQRMPVFGKPVFRKNSGKSFDAMAES